MVRSVLLYGSEVWGLQQEEILERSQVKFFKTLYCLHPSTPDYAIRVEFDLQKLIVQVFRRAVHWVLKVLAMEDMRFPKICLSRQIGLLEFVDRRYSWLGQLRDLFSRAGSLDLWPGLLAGGLQPLDIDRVASDLGNSLLLEDVRRSGESSHCLLYSHLAKREEKIFKSMTLSANKSRLLYQVLFHNAKFQSLFVSGQTNKFLPDSKCQICNSGESDSIVHLITDCPLVSNYKSNKVSQICNRSDLPATERAALIIGSADVNTVREFLDFLIGALRYRHFVLDI